MRDDFSSVYKRVGDVGRLPIIVFGIAAALLLVSFGLSRQHMSEPATVAENTLPEAVGSGDHANNAVVAPVTSPPDASPALGVLLQQLTQERERNADLSLQLAGARQNADIAGDVSAKLLDEQARTAALGMQVAYLRQRDADAYSLREQVEAEQSRATDLDGKLRDLQAAKDALGTQLLAQQRDAALVAKELAATKVAAAQVLDVQAQLDTERKRTAMLASEAAAAQDQAASLATAKSDEDARVLALTREAAAGQRSGEQAADLWKQLAVEQAQAADLGRMLSTERAKSADADAKLHAAETQVATLRESSAHGLPADKAAALAKDLDDERSRAARLERDLAQARQDAKGSAGASAALQLERQSRQQTANRLAAAQMLADQADILGKKLQDEQVVSDALRRELSQSQANDASGRNAQAELKNVGSQMAALRHELDTARTEAARSGDLDGRLQAEMKRSAALDADQGNLRGQIQALQTQSAEQQRRLDAADRTLAASRAESAADQAKLLDEQNLSASLRQKLTTATDAGERLRSLQAQLAAEQQRSAALDSDLQQARGAVLRGTDTEAKLHDSERRSAELSMRLASAQQAANALQDAQRELASERTHMLDLTQTLAATRDKLSAAADLGARLKAAEQSRSADLMTKLDQAQKTAGGFDALQQRWARRLTFDLDVPGQVFAQGKVRPLSFSHDEAMEPGSAGKPATPEPPRALVATQPDEADRSRAAPADGRATRNRAEARSPSTDGPRSDDPHPASQPRNPQPAQSDVVAAAAPLAAREVRPSPRASDVAQPADQPAKDQGRNDTLAWVVLRFPQTSRAAQTKAADVGAVLKATGWGVNETIADTNNFAKDHVVYYYAEDQTRARHIAGLVNITSIDQGRIPMKGSLPRPGTVEVAVAGNH